MKTAEQWIAEKVPDSSSLRHRAYFTTEDIRKIQADALREGIIVAVNQKKPTPALWDFQSNLQDRIASGIAERAKQLDGGIIQFEWRASCSSVEQPKLWEDNRDYPIPREQTDGPMPLCPICCKPHLEAKCPKT